MSRINNKMIICYIEQSYSDQLIVHCTNRIHFYIFSNMTYVYNYLFKKQIIEYMRQNKITNKTSYMNLLNIKVKIVSFNINIADR